jgi:hypothetical protein
MPSGRYDILQLCGIRVVDYIFFLKAADNI